MSSTLLEQTRLLHEEIESKSSTILSLLDHAPYQRESIYNDIMISRLLKSIDEVILQLKNIYKDENNIRKIELQNITTTTIYTGYYERLRTIREYYNKYPTVELTKNTSRIEIASKDFSTIEMSGRYIDLYVYYERSLNLEQFHKIDYYTYMSTFHVFNNIEISKKNSVYKLYIYDLLNYLISFLKRIKPLNNIDDIINKISLDFENRWSCKSINGWTNINNEYNNNPLYCKPCDKLFTKDTVYNAHLPGKKHQKAVSSVSDAGSVRDVELKEIASIEFKIDIMRSLLSEQVADTIAFLEKKQTKTLAELENELEAADDESHMEIEEDELDESKPIYNPLNIPLGWDGKPIPYWLYKLHGLNIEYKCQICGDFSYWGPRAYQRHFQEPRHAQGMRSLGIPNTQAFANITIIDEAKALWEKLKIKQKEEHFVPELQEEVEDNKGNVFTRKDYEELKRHRLL